MRYRRRALHERDASRLQSIPNFAVPEIIVAGEDGVVTGRPPSEGPFSPSPTSDPFGPASPSSPISSRISRPAWDQSQLGASNIITTRTPTSGLRNRAESKPPSPSSPSSGVDLALPDRQWDLDHRPQHQQQQQQQQEQQPRGSSSSYGSPSNSNRNRNHNRASSELSSRTGEGSLSRQSVLEVLDSSAWGDSIRRSFSVRRPSRGDHHAP